MDQSLETYLTFAQHVADQAGAIMLGAFDSALTVRAKADESIVTQADEAVNAMVIREVERAYPAHSVFGEEASRHRDSAYAWVCDPIDGTIMFAKGVPVSVFSLALVKNGEPLVGVVYDPYMKRLYQAIKGQPAHRNNQVIKVSEKPLGYRAIIDSEWWPGANLDTDTATRELGIATGADVLHLGSVAHASCLVAAGKYEVVVFPGTVGKNVDIAAAKVIVEAAGGRVTDLSGNEQRYDRDLNGAIISNGVVHEQTVEAVQKSLAQVVA